MVALTTFEECWHWLVYSASKTSCVSLNFDHAEWRLGIGYEWSRSAITTHLLTAGVREGLVAIPDLDFIAAINRQRSEEEDRRREALRKLPAVLETNAIARSVATWLEGQTELPVTVRPLNKSTKSDDNRSWSYSNNGLAYDVRLALSLSLR